MVKLLKEIQFLCQRTASTNSTYNPTTGALGMIKFLKDSYDKISAIYFEAVFSITFSGTPNSLATGFVQLWNHTDGNLVTNSEVSGVSSSTTYYQLRSSDIKSQLADGDVLYPQQKVNSGVTDTVQIRSAKLIIVQDGHIKKTCTYWLIGDDDTTTSNSAAELARIRRVLDDADEYSGSLTYECHTTIKSSSSSGVYAVQLWDQTNSAQRGVRGGVDTTEVLKTITVGALTDDAELTIRVSISGGHTATIRNAHFIVKQTGAITKTINPIQVWQTEHITNGTTYNAGNFKEANFDPNDYDGMTVDSKHEGSLKRQAGAGAARTIIKDDGTEISSSQLTTAATTYTRLRSVSLAEPGASSDIDFDLKRNFGPAGNAFVCNNRMIIYLTDIEQRRHLDVS